MTMSMTEAADYLKGLAEAVAKRPLGYGYLTDQAGIEAVAYAAAVLGALSESLDGESE